MLRCTRAGFNILLLRLLRRECRQLELQGIQAILLLLLLLVGLLVIIVALQELKVTGGLHAQLQKGRSSDTGRPAETSQFTSWFMRERSLQHESECGRKQAAAMLLR